MYREGRGPQQTLLHGITHPGVLASSVTWSDVNLHPPIILEWGYSAGGESPRIQKFDKVEGLVGNRLTAPGAIVLAFTKDEQWHLTLVPGDSYIHGDDILRLFSETKPPPP